MHKRKHTPLTHTFAFAQMSYTLTWPKRLTSEKVTVMSAAAFDGGPLGTWFGFVNPLSLK